MENKLLRFGALGVLLAAFVFFAAAQARAGSLDEKIQGLEKELAQLKAEQMELRKEATAAAAALPTFSYRPGGGVTMQAADRSWAINFRYVMHVHSYFHPDGSDEDGFSNGDLFWRRNWFWTNYCWADCFYDIQFALDMDTRDQIAIQYTGLYLHFEKMNPYFPTVWITDKGGQTAAYVARSRMSSAQVEQSRDLLNDSDYSTLSHRGIGIGWINVPVGQGDAELTVEYKPGAGIEKNVTDDSDRAQLFLRAGARPFLRSKNPWLDKIKLGGTWQTDSVDSRQAQPLPAGNNRLRLATSDRLGGVTVYDTGGVIGDGMHSNVQLGAEWGIGPYLLRWTNGWSTWEGRNDAFRGVHGSFWSVANDLFLWSPKGPFTGSPRTPGSIQVGWRFERAEAECGSGSDCVPGAGTISRNRLLLRELAAWYYVRPSLRVGAWWNWWDAANMPTGSQDPVGCTSTPSAGKDCDWHTIAVGFGMEF